MSAQIKNIFISHIGEDDAGLVELKDLLENNGMKVRDYSVNSDNPNRAHSEDYIKSRILAPRIQQSSAIVVYVSLKTKYSDFVNWEIEYAHKQNKRIVGVWVHGEKGCELPKTLEKYADAVVGWTGDSIVDAINGTDNWLNPDGVPQSPRQIERYSCA